MFFVGMKTTMYTAIGWFLRNMLRLTGRLIYSITLNGQNNVPSSSGALLVANHVSYLDFLIIVCSVPRHVSFVINADIYNKPSLKWLLRGLQCIPISPRGGKNDFDSFNQEVSRQVNSGNVVIIFAEGTVTRTGQLLEFKKGVEHLSLLITAPVIPIHLHNVHGTPLSFRAGKSKMERFSLKNLRREILVSIGQPIQSPVKAFALRQKIKELEVRNFNTMLSYSKTLDHVIDEAISRAEQGSWKHKQEIFHFNSLRSKLAEINSVLKPLLKEDDCVGLLLPKCHDAYLLNLWLLLNNKIVVNIDPEFDNEERFYILKKSRIRTLITTIDLEFSRYSPNAERIIYTEHIHESIDKGERLHVICNGIQHFSRKVVRALSSSISIDHAATIIYEKTNSDQLKCVSLTGRNLLAVIQGLRQIHYFPKGDVMMSNLPLHHAYGFVIELLIPLLHDLNTNIIADAISADQFLSEIQETKPSLVVATPQQIRSISALAETKNLPYLTHIFTADLDPSHQHIQALKQRGIEVFVCAGQNETASVFAINLRNYHGKDIAGKILEQENNADRSIGKPLPGVAAKICNDNMEEMNAGETGTLWIFGACVSGTNKGIACENKLDNGWYNTGIKAYIDQHGFIYTSAA
jgi:acyl-[acyl-carrier-protein]-phospholipid O-acyltransferase / long-chain-fatty-acid--[acyl-carrier-protein] ligase